MAQAHRDDEIGVFEDALAAIHPDRAAAMLPRVDSALRTTPRSPRLLHVRGLLLRELDRRREAIDSLREAGLLAPDQPKIALALATTLWEAGLPSLDAYAAALTLMPGNEEVIEGLAVALDREGRSADAIAGLDQILARSPGWIKGHSVLARLRFMNGQDDRFTAGHDRTLARHPDMDALWLDQLVLLIHARRFDRALAVIAAGRERLGQRPFLDINEAVVRSLMDQPDRADQLFAVGDPGDDGNVAIRRIAHDIRFGRIDQAGTRIDKWLDSAQRRSIYPYASVVWRLTDDPRWAWLESDPRLVGHYDLAAELPPMADLGATLRALHVAHGQPVEQSVRGGTQTSGNLFQHVDPLLEQTREAVRAAVRRHIAQLPPLDPGHPQYQAPGTPVRFEGSWSVRLTGGGHHAAHTHPFGWFSSALYIALPDAVADRQSGWLTLGEPDPDLRSGLGPLMTVEPRPGRLVLFPSTMWHATRPFDRGERMTIAFDVACPPS